MKNKSALSKNRSLRVKRNTKTANKKTYTAKGELGAGMAYVILALLIIIAGGTLLTGNIIPINKPPTNGQVVIPLPVQTKPAKNNLQLYTFPGVTNTPIPTPTTPPIPTSTPGPTSTPRPTITPGPSPTPGPTSTPRPTSTPGPPPTPWPTTIPTGIAL